MLTAIGAALKDIVKIDTVEEDVDYRMREYAGIAAKVASILL